MTRLAVVIPFPTHRIRRTRRIADVFAPLRDAAEFERAQSRFVMACTATAMVLSLALQFLVA